MGLTHPIMGFSVGGEQASDLGFTSGLFSGIGEVSMGMMMAGKLLRPSVDILVYWILNGTNSIRDI